MQAQRARCYAVNSYEGEGALVSPLIRGDKFASHESGVCVERIICFLAGAGINSCSAEREVDLADKPLEISYCGWIAPFRVGAGRI